MDANEKETTETLARGFSQAIYKCQHDEIHLRLKKVTISLTPMEFGRLAQLLTEAQIRLGVQKAVLQEMPH